MSAPQDHPWEQTPPPQGQDPQTTTEATTPAPVPPARTGLVVASVVGGAVVMLGVGVGLLYLLGVLDTGQGQSAAGASAVTQPASDPTAPSPDPSPSPSASTPAVVIPDNPSEVLDPDTGPALSPLSWDYFAGNEHIVNDYEMVIVGRYDFACDALPQVPALTDALPASACTGGGFGLRTVSAEGTTAAVDLLVIEVSSKNEAEQIKKAYDAANAPATGEPDAALRVAPPAGFESSFAILDAGTGAAFMHTSRSVVVLARLGATDEGDVEEAKDLAKAGLYIVVEHEGAKQF